VERGKWREYGRMGGGCKSSPFLVSG